MGNDNKIKPVIDLDNTANLPEKRKGNEVLLFLQDELIPLRKKKQVTSYDLENEYAKTRKNKDTKIWLTLSLTLVGVILLTWGIVTRMSVSNREIEVNLEAFEDLNLRNLFNALSKTQDLYEKASKNKAELQAALDGRIDQAKRTRDSDIVYIKKLNLPKKSRIEREEKVLQTYRDTVKAAHEEYDEKISAAEIELKQYEEQLKNFDSENVEKAQAWEKEMDSQRQVHEIEKKQLVEEYEAKIEELKTAMASDQERSYKEKRTAVNDVTNYYEAKLGKLDPVVKDANAKSIVQNYIEVAPVDTFDADSIINSVSNPDEEFSQEIYQLKEKYENYVALSNLNSAIPYGNGMSGVVSSEKKIAYDMAHSVATKAVTKINDYKTENARLQNEVEGYKSEISGVKNALGNTGILLDAYAASSKVDGFILGSSEGENYIAYIQSGARANVKNDGSTKVAVYNAENKKVASGAIWFKDSVYFISLDENVQLSAGWFVKISKK
ncbi:MAG: hypothetical protein J6Y36_08650 [Treponema sp.]|nr:hypothetical protein [Treponema sp.]